MYMKSQKDNNTPTQNLPEKLYIMPLEGDPLFPGMITQMTINQPHLLEAIKKAEEDKNNPSYIGLVILKNVEDDAPSLLFPNLHKVGVLAKIHRKIHLPDTSHTTIVFAILERFTIREEIRFTTPLIAQVKYTPMLTQEEINNNQKLLILSHKLINTVKDVITDHNTVSKEFKAEISNMNNPSQLTDFLATMINMNRVERQDILETFDLTKRIMKMLTFLKREEKLIKMQRKIHTQISENINKHHREHFLREMLKEIKSELGEPIDGKTEEIREFRKKLDAYPIQENIKIQIAKEIDKFELLDSHHHEYHIMANYLDKIFSLPWANAPKKDINLAFAANTLNKQHYGMEKVKERVIEHLAIQKFENARTKSIICLVGPPGVGKTSIAESIATAMQKKHYHFSVGGMRDEAEIKGHRRTYIGAMPGKIIQGLLSVQEKDPVFIIDEIDKLAQSAHGDPSSALLEVLDPVQNSAFRDLYMDIPFDLSQILFITTANTTHSIPRALLDRMEVIRLSGYVDEEKFVIAKK